MKLLGKSRTWDQGSKSRIQGRGYHLSGHIVETLDMARFLMDDVPFGRQLHTAMKLTAPFETFRQVVLVGTLIHDLGKAGTDFQEFIRSVETRHWKWQRYRHEHLTAWLLTHHPEIRDWLVDAVGGDEHLANVATAAAFGHHMKTHRLAEPDEPGHTRVFLMTLSRALNTLSRQYGLEPFPILPNRDVPIRSLHDDIQDMLYTGGKEDSFAMAVKWCVTISDTLGSFNPADSSQYKHVVEYRKALYGRIRKLFEPRQHDFMSRCPQVALDNPRDVQWKALDLQGQSGMLVAPCGDGKTVAAFLWASEDRNLIFTTPTTGTATQIYLDHVADHPDVLIHSRSRVDHALFATPEGDDKETATEQAEWDEAFQQFFDYGRPVSYTTVDQVAGLLVNSRKSILWLLHLVNSQVVFDEFHAYGPRLAAYHLWFVETFPGIPTLSMSATGTTSHLTALQKVRPDLRYRRGIGSQENEPRYFIHVLDSVGKLPAQMAATTGPAKTLWIVNRVKECQRLARENPDALCYHSRFRYQDRRQIHADFIEAFRNSPTPSYAVRPYGILGIATQVCEISLDISATRLISEIAPVPSILQRLGRLNRVYKGEACHAYLYIPAKNAPYTEHFDPQLIADWLRSFEGRAVSQRELVECFEHTRYAQLRHRQLTRRPLMQTVRMPLREAINCRALWEVDFDAHGPALLRDAVQLGALEIPMSLSKKQRQGLSKQGHHYIIPNYDPRLGVAA
jgi:CRISPR-associated endonuclease/helicase Cas3